MASRVHLKQLDKLLFEFDHKSGKALFNQDSTFILVDEFNKLYRNHERGAEWLKWICLVYDYDSPYRNLPVDDRMRKASNAIFSNNVLPVKPLEHPLVSAAITKYRELQYDPILEQHDLYMEKIHFFNAFIRNQKPESADEMIDLQKVMENSKKITDIALELRRKVQEMTKRNKHLRGGVKKSALESQLNDILKEVEREGLMNRGEDGRATDH